MHVFSMQQAESQCNLRQLTEESHPQFEYALIRIAARRRRFGGTASRSIENESVDVSVAALMLGNLAFRSGSLGSLPQCKYAPE